MISQSTKMNTESLYPLNKLDTVKEKNYDEKPIEETNAVLKDPKDVLTISDNGKIDHSLFSFLDKGGDASKALTGGTETNVSNALAAGAENEVSFAIKPSFLNVSKSRYTQMKSEIERNFADDPSARSKYLKELDKALDDYIQIYAEIADALTTKEEENPESGEREDKTANYLEMKKLSETNQEETNQIIEKIFGKTESSYSDEMSGIVDDFYIKTLKQKTNGIEKKHALNQDLKDPKIVQMWNTVKFQSNRSES